VPKVVCTEESLEMVCVHCAAKVSNVKIDILVFLTISVQCKSFTTDVIDRP